MLRQRTAMASSRPAPMEWPVKPLVLLTITLLTSLPKVDFKAYASALAEPPRAGVYVSCEMNTSCLAMSERFKPKSFSARDTRSFITCATWATSRRVTWKPLLRISVESTLASGFIPRLATSLSSSTTKDTAPIPTIIPFLRRSKGRAALVTSASVVAAPEARKAVKIHSDTLSLVISSALMTMTRLQRPSLIQSCAMATAWAVEAQAALIEVAGPLARIHWQKWEWAMIIVFKINSEVKASGSTSLSLKLA